MTSGPALTAGPPNQACDCGYSLQLIASAGQPSIAS
jgi:hypothetical protein